MNTSQVSIFDVQPSGYIIPPYLPEDVQKKAVRFVEEIQRLNPKYESVDEAIESVYENASEEWKARSRMILRTLCESRSEFDLDDLSDALATIVHLETEKRDRGQLLRNAKKEGWCRFSHYGKSKRKSRHYGTISVYESLLFTV